MNQGNELETITEALLSDSSSLRRLLRVSL